MSFIDVKIHAVWGTKRRVPFLQSHVRSGLIPHMKANAAKNKIVIDRLDGHDDHLHCLFHLPATKCIADVIHDLKGESSRWLNEQGILQALFRWCVGYYARSVSRADLQIVRNYIDNHSISAAAVDPELDVYLRRDRSA